MATVVEYNNVTIHGCLTKEFIQEAVYDDSGTDLLFTKFRVTVVGFIHSVDLDDAPAPKVVNAASPWTGPIKTPRPTNAPNAFSGGAAETAVYLRHALSEPRKPFKMTVGTGHAASGGPSGSAAAVLLQAIPVGSTRTLLDDLNNGPKPTILNFTKITGNNIFRIEFSIEVCRLECDSSSQSLSVVLSNRWTMADNYDADFMCTRTMQGRLRLSHGDVNPHNFRGIVIPALGQGFSRQSMDFIASADGLHLDYTIVDREVVFSAPAPATTWEMVHRESCGNGQTGTGEVVVTLNGPRDAGAAPLLQIACQICENKLGLSAVGRGVLKHLELAVHRGTHANRVEARAVVEHIVEIPRNYLGIVDLPTLNQWVQQALTEASIRLVRPVGGDIILGYDPRISRNPGISGLVPITGAFSAHLQNPCLDSHLYTDAKNPPTESPILDSTDVEVNETIVPPASFVESPYQSEEHKTAIYTFTQVEALYKKQVLGAHMAVAKSRTSSGTNQYPDSVFARLGELNSVTFNVIMERAGQWPTMPNPTDFTDPATGIQFWLKVSRILARNADVTPDGTPILYAQVEYDYAMSRGYRDDERHIVPPLPWLYSGGATQVGGNFLTGSILGNQLQGTIAG